MEKPRPISGFRSRAINAGYDYTAAVAPVAGDGATVADGPGGRVISFSPRLAAGEPHPWRVEPVAVPGETDKNAVTWKLRVYCGAAVWAADGGEAVALAFGDGGEDAVPSSAGPESRGMATRLIAADDMPPASGWRYLLLAADDSSGEPSECYFRFGEEAAGAGEHGLNAVAVAKILFESAGSAPQVRNLAMPYVVAFGASAAAEHFGDAAGATKEPAWNIADDKPAILETEGAKILVDSRGNVIAWTTPPGGGGESEDPSAPTPPPPCGNPLNGDVTDNPLDRPAADRGTDYNPLDYPGRGGYTPESSGEQC